MSWVFKQQRNSSTRYSIIILRDESHVIKWYFILMVQPITTITQCPDQYSSPCYATQNCFACIQSDSCEWNHSSKKCQAVKLITQSSYPFSLKIWQPACHFTILKPDLNYAQPSPKKTGNETKENSDHSCFSLQYFGHQWNSERKFLELK
jgi:hypothetical protein